MQRPGRRELIIAVLGAGKIGEAVARASAKSPKVSQVLVTKRNVSTLRRPLPKKIVASTDNAAAAKKADVVILAVKASDAKHLLDEISGETHGKIVISFMAAISLSRLERHLPKAKVVRAMTNMAAIVGEAATAYSPGSSVTTADLETVKFVLGRLGESVELPEPQLDAVTALSGSGPAYIAILIDALVTAGLKVGLPRDVSFKLATQTLVGTAKLLRETGMGISELRDAVTTPAGTTIAGIYELEKGSFRTAVINAVEAATIAAEKVAKKFDVEH
ncbi:MAG: pyrroline-5-carboxylate reductase [Thaumarchaeota archaeon]|nr:pyrroline-5-carboxylate reductase [Nitrososphaerota archaeon]